MKTIHTMKSTKGTRNLRTLALLGLSVGLAMPMGLKAQAQPAANGGLGTNPPNRQRKRGQKGQKAKSLAKMQERELANAEAVAGKPLTDEQKQKVRDAVKEREDVLATAREKYATDLAASLGMEPDAVRLKLREANAKARANGMAGAAGGAAAGAAGARRRNRGGAGGAAVAGG